MTTAENPPTSTPAPSPAEPPTAATRTATAAPTSGAIPAPQTDSVVATAESAAVADDDSVIPAAQADPTAADMSEAGAEPVTVDEQSDADDTAAGSAKNVLRGGSGRVRRGWVGVGRRVGLPTVLAVAVVIVLSAGGLGVGAGHFAGARDQLRGSAAAEDVQAGDRAAALKVGGDFLAAAYTVDAVNDKGMAKWNAAMTGATTDTLKEQVRQTKALLSLLAESDASMTGVVSDAAVISQNDTLIRVLAVVKLTGNAPGQAAPTTGSVTEYVDLMKVGGQWKVFGYKDIGSKTGAGQDGALAGLPAAQPGPAK